jgi:hypothetical protein
MWFLTNLSVDRFSPQEVSTLYRYRFEIEQLFRVLKTVGRLDQLKSSNPCVFKTFMYATLLGIVLCHGLCAHMRQVKPECEPSPHRIYALLLQVLPGILQDLGTEREIKTLKAFVKALWKEGVNPNPGRPYTGTRYAKELMEMKTSRMAA